MEFIKKHKNIILLVAQFVAFVLGLIAILLQVLRPVEDGNGVNSNGLTAFKFFTNDGNIYCFIVSLVIILYSIFSKSEKKNQIVYLLTLSQAVVGSIIFLVVVLVLTPMMGFGLLQGYTMIVLHAVNPILFMVLFFCFTQKEKKEKLYVLALLPSPVYLYGIVAIILCVCKVWTGNGIPYPFLDVYNNPPIVSVLSAVGILGGAFLITYLFDLIYTKCHKTKNCIGEK